MSSESPSQLGYGQVDRPTASRDLVGREVQHLRILERIGSGGMGEVYVAEDSRLGRRVAVKAIRPEHWLDRESRARFLREARVLSQLDHPNICRLFEYVEDQAGDFLVLELIDGRGLREAVGGLSRDERLAVAEQIASGLVAAHGKGVIHRDLKPDNVMLTSGGGVKVLDFGIARSTAADSGEGGDEGEGATGPGGLDGGDAGELTTRGAVLGTVRYMSPEQARGEPVTPASDIYSLGLLFHELFSTDPPYEKGISGRELVLLAAEGATGPVSGVPSDLRVLVKRMESREPALRPTAPDVQEKLRQIRDAPRRRRRQLAGVGLTVVLAAASVALALLAVRVDKEARRANRAAAQASETTEFLLDLFEVADPVHGEGADTTAGELLDRGVERLRGRLRDHPETRARLLKTAGGVYERLGLYPRSADLLEEALEVAEQGSGSERGSVVEFLRPLASVYARQGRYGEAGALLQRARAIAEREGAVPLMLAAIDHDEMILLSREGRFSEAEVLGRRCVATRERWLGPDHPDTGLSKGILGLVLLDLGAYGEAEPLLAGALELQERDLPSEHPQVVASLVNLASVRKELGRLDEAEIMYRRAMSLFEQRLGPDHPDVAVASNDLAVVLTLQGRYPEAEEVYRRSVDIARAALGDGHPITAVFLANLAESVHLGGRPEEAEPLFRRSLGVARSALGDRHPVVAEAARGLGVVLADLGQPEEGEALLLECVRIREDALGPEHPDLGRALGHLGDLYASQGREAEARDTWSRAISILEPALGAQDELVRRYSRRIAELPSAR